MYLKRLLTVLAFCNVTLSALAAETPLLPEVKQVLDIQAIDESSMDQNAYVFMFVMDAPANSNYLPVAKKVILSNYKLLTEAIAKQQGELIKYPDNPENYLGENYQLTMGMGYGGGYTFPCRTLTNQNCFMEIIEDKNQLDELINKNKASLMRYQHIIELPIYNNYYSTAETPMAPFQNIIYSSQLRLAQAAFLIDEGKVEQGLTMLQQEVDFAKRILMGESYLIDSLIAIRQLLTTYHLIAELLDSPKLAAYLNKPQLINLLKPLSKAEQQAFVKIFKKEREFAILTVYLADAKESVEDEYQQETNELYSEAIKANYPLNLDKNTTANEFYNNREGLIKLAMLTLPEASEQYLKDSQQLAEKLASIDDLYSQYGDSNLLGGIWLNTDGDNRFRDYLYRFYDVSNYLALVNAKLYIKQAGITKQQVPEFLAKLADKAVNPYSQKPFVWSDQQQLLFSDWLSFPIDEERDGSRAALSIQFPK